MTKIERVSAGTKHLEWVPLAKMRISPRAQRTHNKPSSIQRIDHIASNFDPDLCGALVVSERDGLYWIIDGGHRYLALLAMGYEDQQAQCWVYRDLAEEVEADKFLSHNDVKTVSIMDKFRVGVVAKRPVETDIDRIVRAADLSVGSGLDSIGCVGALLKVYDHGPRVLATTLRTVRDSYGTPGFNSKITEGIGLFIANYENIFDEERLIKSLSGIAGGVNGLSARAEGIRKQYGVTLSIAVAAAVVETYNRGRGRGKLNGWWSTFNPQKSDTP